MVLMKGLGVKDMKHSPALGILFGCFGFGFAVGGWYLAWICIKDLDTSFVRSSNPIPYQKVKPDEKVNLYSYYIDYSKLTFPKERPNLD